MIRLKPRPLQGQGSACKVFDKGETNSSAGGSKSGGRDGYAKDEMSQPRREPLVSGGAIGVSQAELALRAAAQGSGRWDMHPSPGAPREDVAVMGSLHRKTGALHLPRRVRECYFGNLAQGLVTQAVLEEAIHALFQMLPAYQHCYPELPHPVRSTALHSRPSNPLYAFVEFHDEVLASTAIRMSGFELRGRQVIIKRPQCFGAAQEVPPLDTEPLQRANLVQHVPGVRLKLSVGSEKEVLVGNLPCEQVTEEVMVYLFAPACLKLEEYDEALGPPVTEVQLSPNRTYCFVAFQSEKLAAAAIRLFDDALLFGRRLRVRRPLSCLDRSGGGARQPAPESAELATPVAGEGKSCGSLTQVKGRVLDFVPTSLRLRHSSSADSATSAAAPPPSAAAAECGGGEARDDEDEEEEEQQQQGTPPPGVQPPLKTRAEVLEASFEGSPAAAPHPVAEEEEEEAIARRGGDGPLSQ